jgi:hypothetical protein
MSCFFFSEAYNLFSALYHAFSALDSAKLCTSEADTAAAQPQIDHLKNKPTS